MAFPGSRLWHAERRARIARAEFEAERNARRSDAMRIVYGAFAGSFDASTRSRLRPGPRPQAGSGQAHRDNLSRDNLRRDCQEAYRNNPIAQAVVDRKVELVVGGGPVLQVQTGDPDFNERAEDLFNEWAATGCDIAGQATLTELLEQAVASWYTDGRLAFLKARGPRGEGVLQAIEDERLRNPGNRPNDETYVAGVERDASGRPLRYHVADWQRDGSYVSTRTTPYDARHLVVLRNPRCRVPGVVAPEPVLASILSLLELIDESIESTAIAYRIATLFGAIVTGENPGGEMDALVNGSNADDYDGSADDDDARGYALQPGMIWHRETKGTATQLDPKHPATGVDRFLWAVVQVIAARAAMPVDLTHFVMDRNWSGTRSRLAVAWRGVQCEQRAVTAALLAVSRWKVGEWIRDGRLEPVPGWHLHTWVPAPMPMLDPAQEIKTRRDAVDARFMDYQRVLDETGGGDFETTARKIGAQMGLLRDLKIEPVTAGAAPAPGAGGAQVGDETETGMPENVGA